MLLAKLKFCDHVSVVEYLNLTRQINILSNCSQIDRSCTRIQRISSGFVICTTGRLTGGTYITIVDLLSEPAELVAVTTNVFVPCTSCALSRTKKPALYVNPLTSGHSIEPLLDSHYQYAG